MSDKHPLEKPKPFDDCPSVELTDKQIGRAVNLAERVSKKPNAKISFGNNYHANTAIAGFSGELAFLKYYQLNDELEYLTGGDNGWDYKVWTEKLNDSLTIDVKTITYPVGDLLIRKDRHERLKKDDILPDAYCLIEKRHQLFGIVGFLWSREVTDYQSFPTGVFSPVEVYKIPREKLSTPPSPRELMSYDQELDELTKNSNDFLENIE